MVLFFGWCCLAGASRFFYGKIYVQTDSVAPKKNDERKIHCRNINVQNVYVYLFTYLSKDTAIKLYTDAATDTPWIYGTVLHINQPSIHAVVVIKKRRKDEWMRICGRRMRRNRKEEEDDNEKGKRISLCNQI